MSCCRYPVGWVVRFLSTITSTHLSVVTFKFEAENDDDEEPEEWQAVDKILTRLYDGKLSGLRVEFHVCGKRSAKYEALLPGMKEKGAFYVLHSND